MLVLTYATGPTYLDSAAALRDSGNKFGVAVNVISRPDLKSWWKNVARKPAIIQELLTLKQETVLFVDADCRFVGRLDGLDMGDYDVLIRHRPGAKEPYNTGVMAVAHNPRTLDFLKTWRQMTERYGHRGETCDQTFVAKALRTTGVKIGDLPAKFNATLHDKLDDTRITHAKVSRDNVVLSAWRAERRLEWVLAERTRDYLCTPAAVVTALYGADSRVPTSGVGPDVELIAVDRPEKNTRAASHWYTDPATMVVCLGTATVPQFTAADVGALNAVALMRQKIVPKPNDVDPPKHARLYYPAFKAVGRTGHELSGFNAWTAALNAVAIRGGRSVVVSPPDGLRTVIADACDEMNLELTWG